jgi:hypothetical protein
VGVKGGNFFVEELDAVAKFGGHRDVGDVRGSADRNRMKIPARSEFVSISIPNNLLFYTSRARSQSQRRGKRIQIGSV